MEKTMNLQEAKSVIEKKTPPVQEQELLEKGTKQYIEENKAKHLCSFCKHPSMIEVDHSDMTLCTHCFKLIYDNLGHLRTFLGMNA